MKNTKQNFLPEKGRDNVKKLLSLLPYALISLLAISITAAYAQERRFVVTEEYLLIYLEESYFVVAAQEDNFIGGYPKDTKIKDENGAPITLEELHTGDCLLITSKDGVLLHESPPPFRHILEIRKTGETNTALAEEYFQRYDSRFHS